MKIKKINSINKRVKKIKPGMERSAMNGYPCKRSFLVRSYKPFKKFEEKLNIFFI